MQKLVKLRIKFLIILNILLLKNLNFAAGLKQADLVSKTDYGNKISFNRQITSNKTRPLEVQKKLNILITKDYNFLLVRIYFTSNDGSQNRFDALELKIDKGTGYALSWKSKRLYNSKLIPLYTAFLNSIKLSECRIIIKFDKDPFDQNCK